ncbi:LysR family transcriptional regulator [Pseudomonas sp. LRF_L74]|uniref:LysR family transcriptional regulator n=1 Tax=Pseudomonas sp. LRF_L74 TaxID=3369422 RepID=UPI003F63BEFD
MDLRQLRYFIALTEHRSFVRAAEAMNITQPAFSRSIQGLEQEFGCQLVDRGSKDLRPTPEGQVVLQHALSLVQGASNLVHEVSQMSKLDTGELHFGCGPVPAIKLIPDTLIHFMGKYPGIRPRLQVNNWENLGRSLMRNEIEFFIADIRQFQSDPNFQTHALTPRPAVFFCRSGHPLQDKESLSTNDLFEYPLAAIRLGIGTRKALANLSGKASFEQHIECEHIPLLEQIVRNTNAIGLGPLEAVRDAVGKGELIQLQLRNLPNSYALQAHCGVVTRTGYRLSPAARAMIDLVKERDQNLAAAA